MELVLVKWLLLGLMILLAQSNGSKGWIEEERVSLLQIKASIPIDKGNNDGEEYLATWVDDQNSDYCEWEGVTCNSTTSHVIHLSLYNISRIQYYYDPNSDDEMDDSCPEYETKWSLNFSTFVQFEELASLNLSFNRIGGFINDEGPGFERLNKLEVLNLSHNCLDSKSLLSMAALTSLKALFLKSNRMEGSIPAKDLAKLKNLEILDLSRNRFISTLLKVGDLERLSSLNKLEVLDLSHNRLDSKILSSIAALTSLKALIFTSNKMEGSIPIKVFSTLKNLEILDLGFNNLEGSVPENTQALSSLKALSLRGNFFNGSLLGFCEMKRLEELDLRENFFGGNLPGCLQNLTSLKYLDISENQFTGNIPPNIIGSLKSLEYINLRINHFEGLFSFKIFANSSRLEIVVLDCNNNMKVESKYPGWVPSFQLKHLFLRKCGLGNIPEFFLHQFKLATLDLSHNNIEARFPNWLIENNTGLVFLSFKNNSFNGQIQGIGEKIFPNMNYLNLAQNSFEGYFPLSPGDDCKLETLDLSFNKFSGEVPDKLLSTCTSLIILKLDHNKFHGKVFTSRFNLTGLYSLELNDNQFVGTLSSLNTKFSSLSLFNLSNNCFHGEIPSGLIDNTFSTIIDFSHNYFQGEITCELLSVECLDLSHNSFSRVSPSCLTRYPLYVNLQANNLSGSLPEVFLNMSDLQILDLRENNFSGSISDSFVAFQGLRILLLGGNHFNGTIPNWLCELNDLSLLDLSRNSFIGSIPQCLCNLFSSEIQSLGYNGFTTSASSKERLLCSGLIIKFYLPYGLSFIMQQHVEFVTKKLTLTYRGDILNYMSGLDLSQNNLIGEIPYELGNLSQLHALNLSHNQLTGSIPISFSNISQLESLDLSYNKLSGKIPPQLIVLFCLEVFSVAYNNLSGMTPDMKYQFGTFDKSSFEGNPLLCGPLVEKSCSGDRDESNSSATPLPNEVGGKWYEIHHVVFLASFCVSFIMFFVGIITVLHINPNWQYKLVYHTKELMISFYYFLYDNVFKFFICLFR